MRKGPHILQIKSSRS